MAKKQTVPTGTPPDNVERQRRVKELILSGEDLTPEYEESEESQVVTVPPVNKPLQRVIIRHELYKLRLPVLDVSVGEHQVAIRLPDSGLWFEPSEMNGDFMVEYLGKQYSVVYLGGIFEFPGDSSWVIAFIRDKRKEQDNEEELED